MPDRDGDRSQEATPHRRQQARQEGQVAKSQDLASAVILIGGIIGLLLLGGATVDFMGNTARRQLGGDPWLSADVSFITNAWNGTLVELAKAILPVLGLLLVLGIAVNLMQVGFLFVPKRLAPDLTRIDPIKGLARLFSLSGLVRLGLGIFKIIVVAVVAMWSLWAQRVAILGMTELEPGQIAAFLIELLLWTALKVGIALLILAIIDYAYQRWKHEQDLMMTPQEMREELRNLQGDPQIIARRRAVQRQMALNRLSSAVPKADVVITNPTELAIAIRYDLETMAAPMVVAKGAGVIAARIRKLALEHGIPVIEKKPLAQALYKEVDVNEQIPHGLYAAVAEVLAYVYQLQGKPLPKPKAAA